MLLPRLFVDLRFLLIYKCLTFFSLPQALLQFAVCGSKTTAVPASVHCDHLISAYEGAEADLKRATVSNKEVFDFLESAYVFIQCPCDLVWVCLSAADDS